MLSDAGIDRKKIVLWNTISTWNGTIEITSSEREKSSEQLLELLKVLKKVKTIVLVGRNAQKMEEYLDTSKYNVISSFHTSNKVKNNDKEKWNSILLSFKEAAKLTGL